jgi:hypothetical protein
MLVPTRQIRSSAIKTRQTVTAVMAVPLVVSWVLACSTVHEIRWSRRMISAWRSDIGSCQRRNEALCSGLHVLRCLKARQRPTNLQSI